MSDERVQYSIDGDDAAPAKRHTDANAAADMEIERTRRVLTEKAAVQNDLLQARREHAAVHLDRINTEAERAAQDYQQAWENGDSAKMVESQREIAALEVRRANTQSVADRLDRTQAVPTDPVEAFAAGRSSQAAAWIRSHPDYVMGGRKTAKLQAAHSDAIAEGITPDTEQYFRYVDQFLGIDEGGAGRRQRDSGGAPLRVRVTADPNKQLAQGEVRMTPGEYKAATETLTWNYDSPDGKYKRGDNLGVAEYLRRKGIMMKQGGYYDKLD
jgi:hypothetical protein